MKKVMHLSFDDHCIKYSSIQYYIKSYFLGHISPEKEIACFDAQFSIFDIASKLTKQRFRSRKKKSKPLVAVSTKALNVRYIINPLDRVFLKRYILTNYITRFSPTSKFLLSSFNRTLFCLNSLKKNTKKGTLFILKPIPAGFRCFSLGLVGFFSTCKLLRSFYIPSKLKVNRMVFQTEVRHLLFRVCFSKIKVSLFHKKQRNLFVKNRRKKKKYRSCIRTTFS